MGSHRSVSSNRKARSPFNNLGGSCDENELQRVEWRLLSGEVVIIRTGMVSMERNQ
jgi:hypothetical protein